jgi:hypothetical protein
MTYVRFIHKISQNPEADTVKVPSKVRLDGTLHEIWNALRRAGIAFDKDPRGDHRLQDGGIVFFLRGSFHSLIVMPEGSDLHRKHAPPSHFQPGGPLHEPESEGATA